MEHVFYDNDTFMPKDFPFKMEFGKGRSLNKVLHSHESFQICYILKGMCMHTVGNKTFTLTKGDIFSIPPYEKHQLHNMKEKESELVQIDFMPSFIDENLSGMGSADGIADFLYLQPLSALSDSVMPKLKISVQNTARIEQLIESMSSEYKEKPEGYLLSIKADLLKLLVIIAREFKQYMGDGSDNNAAILQCKNRFNEIIRDIETNYSHEWSLRDVAERANMSPAYFSHMFKLYKGCSMVNFINRTRIYKSMNYLSTSDYNVTEICFMVGYTNLGHFTRMFKRITGSTPSEFKKAARSKSFQHRQCQT